MKKLLARLAQIKADSAALITNADANNDGELTAEEQVTLDALVAEHAKVAGQIDQRIKIEKMNASDTSGGGRQAAPLAPGSHVTIKDNIDPNCGYQDIGEFALSVRVAGARTGGAPDERLNVLGAPTGFMKESGSDEGYAVPPQFRDEIWAEVFAGDTLDLLSMVYSEPTNSNAVELLKDETTPWGATGVVARWGSEGKPLEGSSIDTSASLLKLAKLYAFVLATDELLEDSPRLQSRLTKGAGEAIRWAANESIMTGKGNGELTGFMNSGALVTVADDGAQGADTLVVDNILQMYSRMLAGSIPRAVWFGNSEIIPSLASMVIGNDRIWSPPIAATESQNSGFLFGRPLILTEHAEPIGTPGDLSFVDPKGYYLAKKSAGMKFAQSIHLFFDYDIQAFKWSLRIGGRPFLSAPVDPAKGTKTKSHFVVVEERT